MSTVVIRSRPEGLWLDKKWLEEASLSGELEAVILPNAIIIKPRSLTAITRGIVKTVLDEETLEELYKERSAL